MAGEWVSGVVTDTSRPSRSTPRLRTDGRRFTFMTLTSAGRSGRRSMYLLDEDETIYGLNSNSDDGEKTWEEPCQRRQLGHDADEMQWI